MQPRTRTRNRQVCDKNIGKLLIRKVFGETLETFLFPFSTFFQKNVDDKNYTRVIL